MTGATQTDWQSSRISRNCWAQGEWPAEGCPPPYQWLACFRRRRKRVREPRRPAGLPREAAEGQPMLLPVGVPSVQRSPTTAAPVDHPASVPWCASVFGPLCRTASIGRDKSRGHVGRPAETETTALPSRSGEGLGRTVL